MHFLWIQCDEMTGCVGEVLENCGVVNIPDFLPFISVLAMSGLSLFAYSYFTYCTPDLPTVLLIYLLLSVFCLLCKKGNSVDINQQ